MLYLKVESRLRHRTLRSCELETGFSSFWSNLLINLFTIREESFNDLKSFVIDSLIFMRLESLNPVQSSTLLNHHGDLVGFTKFLSCYRILAIPSRTTPTVLSSFAAKRSQKG